jgi:hypothetical protein
MAPAPNLSVHIDNVIISANRHGMISAIPIRLLDKRGVDYSQVQRRTFGNRLIDNTMIFRVMSRELTLGEVLVQGTPF